MEIFKSPNILFIKGVFKSNCKSFEQLVDEKYTCEMDPQPQPADIQKYDELPNHFYNIANWPKNINLKCATCNGDCRQQLVCIPKYIEKNKEGVLEWGIYKVPFDSFPCAAFHIQYFLANDSQYKLRLAKFYELFHPDEPLIGEITPSLPPWRLKEHGGDLSRPEYHKLNEINNKKFNTITDSYFGNATPQE